MRAWRGGSRVGNEALGRTGKGRWGWWSHGLGGGGRALLRRRKVLALRPHGSRGARGSGEGLQKRQSGAFLTQEWRQGAWVYSQQGSSSL